MKKLLFISIMLIFSLGTAQIGTEDRVMINGSIHAPGGESLEGIAVVNRNSRRATMSDRNGNFSIPVAVGDSLAFKSLQFQDFSVIVDQGVVDTRQLNVYLSEAVTVLPEVVVRPYDLSGNVRADVEVIPTADVDLPAMSAAEINQYEWDFRPDEMTSPANPAMRNEMLRKGRNLARIFRSIFTQRRAMDYHGDTDERNVSNIDDQILSLYDDEFFKEYLDIKEENIHEFIFFAEDNGLTPEMLEEENELELIEFLMDQSEKYKEVKRRG